MANFVRGIPPVCSSGHCYSRALCRVATAAQEIGLLEGFYEVHQDIAVGRWAPEFVQLVELTVVERPRAQLINRVEFLGLAFAKSK